MKKRMGGKIANAWLLFWVVLIDVLLSFNLIYVSVFAHPSRMNRRHSNL
jgi:hypothetical protein